MSKSNPNKIDLADFANLHVNCQHVAFAIKQGYANYNTPDGHLDSDIAINNISLAAASLKNNNTVDKKRIYTNYSALLVGNVAPEKVPEVREYIKGQAAYMLAKPVDTSVAAKTPEIN